LNKYFHTGALSVAAIAFSLALGDQSAAFAQQVGIGMPVVAGALPAVRAALPAIDYSLPDLQPTLIKPLARGNIFTLPLRPATVVIKQPLSALVEAQAAGSALDTEGNCLATAVYFESMGEPLEGQLAVAQVVMNRAQSGRYPTSWCAVVKQKAQFSFVRSGRFPRIDPACQAWRKAQAIARIAAARMAEVLPADVLWYHADYVAPGWGRRLARVEKIGAHIFYRA